MSENKTVIAVDVGTSKISCLIGERVDGGVEVIGKGQAPSHGVKKGAIDDIEECSQSIELAIVEAENCAGVRVNQIVAGISGEYISTFCGRGRVAITNKGNEITSADVSRALSLAKPDKDMEDLRLLHAIPRMYSIDGEMGVKNPVGLIGNHLEVDAYMVAGSRTHLANIAKAFNLNGLEIEPGGFVLSSIGAARAVLAESEKNLGVVLIDIGAGTTKIAVYKGGFLIHSRTLSLGSDSLTYDIAMCFRIPLVEAENLKIKYASACPDLLSEEEQTQQVAALSFSESEDTVLVPRKELSCIVEARLMEIFEAISRDLKRLYSKGIYIAGAIITGGASKMRHVNYIAQRILDLPTKIGRPTNIQGLGDWEGNPEYSSVAGILQLASERKAISVPVVKNKTGRVTHAFKKVWSWLQEVL